MDYDFTYTGAEIQAILDTAKKLKDSGYIFLGVATPSTNPSTPTQKVYYEAKQAGTYTNFGGVVLPDGISLLKWNGSWTSETVMCGDGGVFDISVYKSSGGTLATFADLSAALDGGNNIPASARKGGMSVKYVQSSDNKYMQFRCKTQSFSTNPEDWYFEGSDTLVENTEFKYVCLTKDKKILFGIKANDDFVFGAGVPQQIIDYVTEKCKEYDDIVTFVGNLVEEGTLEILLNTKVDKVSGKSLIGEDVANSLKYVENTEFKFACLTKDNKILFAVKHNDNFFFGAGVPQQIIDYVTEKCKEKVDKVSGKGLIEEDVANSLKFIENIEFAKAILDGKNKLLEAIDSKFTKIFYTDVEFKGNVKFSKGIENNEDVVSTKYASPRKLLNNPIGTTQQNNRVYTEGYMSQIYNLCYKCGLGIIRDYAELVIQQVTSENMDVITEALLPNAFNQITQSHIDYITTLLNVYDGEEHTVNGTIVKSKIMNWAFYNEPDLYYTIGSQQAQTLFDNMKVLYNLVKSLRPECSVVFGEFSDLGSQLFKDIAEIRDNDGKAIWDYCDIISFHNYNNRVDDLEAYKLLCDNTYSVDEYKHLKDVPLWVTEFGTAAFSENNKEENRRCQLPKRAIELLSFGIEKVLFYKLVEYNMFVVTSQNNYYGLISPQYDLPFAGFFYNDENKTSLSPDKLLDKTYIYGAGYYPNINLSRLNKSQIQTKGIAINGDGFYITDIHIAQFDARMEIIDIVKTWHINESMQAGENYVTIDGSEFLDSYFDATESCYLVMEITSIEETSKEITSFIFKDSYYAMKLLSSLFTGECSVPNIVKEPNGITVASWKSSNGYKNYCVWSTNGNSIDVSVKIPNNAILYDVLGNVLLTFPTTITKEPVYITNVTEIIF